MLRSISCYATFAYLSAKKHKACVRVALSMAHLDQAATSRACREVGDAIPLPVDQLKGVLAAVRGSMGANVPQAAEVRPAAAASLESGNHIPVVEVSIGKDPLLQR